MTALVGHDKDRTATVLDFAHRLLLASADTSSGEGALAGLLGELAKAYGCRGATILLADRDADALRTATAALDREGLDAHAEPVDICDAAAVDSLVERARALGPVGAVCLNAGVSGDTMSGGLARLDWSVPDGTDAVQRRSLRLASR